MTCEIRNDCGSLGSSEFPPEDVEIQRSRSNRNGLAKIQRQKTSESGSTWAQNFRQVELVVFHQNDTSVSPHNPEKRKTFRRKLTLLDPTI
uniref:Uncharacterized protein n=1 Tax=Cucumis melo TaxID=3656 RepID=A0A9I9DSH4_CUCME